MFRIFLALALVGITGCYDFASYTGPTNPGPYQGPTGVTVQVIDSNGFGVSGVEVKISLKENSFTGVSTTAGGGYVGFNVVGLTKADEATVVLTVPPGFVLDQNASATKTLALSPGQWASNVVFRIIRK